MFLTRRTRKKKKGQTKQTLWSFSSFDFFLLQLPGLREKLA
jgi:hypothetical protein